MQESADDFEFSAERLSENAKSIKITLFAELLTVISYISVQSSLNVILFWMYDLNSYDDCSCHHNARRNGICPADKKEPDG